MDSDINETEVGKITIGKLLYLFQGAINYLIDYKDLARKNDLKEVIQLIEGNKILDDVDKMIKKINSFDNRLKKDEYEDRLKKDTKLNNNLIFRGLDGITGEPADIIYTVCLDILGIALRVNEIQRVRKIIRKDGKVLYKVTFNNNKSVKDIMDNARKLKGSGYFIDRDYPRDVREKRKKLFQARKEILEKEGNVKVFIRNEMLIKNNEAYYWDENEGLKLIGDYKRSVSGSHRMLAKN